MDPQTLYQEPLLTDVAQRYHNRKFIAEEIFPEVLVDQERFYYHVFDRGVVFKRQPTRYGPNGTANELDLKATKVLGNTESRALKAYIDEKEERQAGGLSIESLKTEAIVEALKLDLEIEIATQLRSTSVLTQNATLSGTSQWSDFTNSDPKNEVLTRKQSLILDANVMIVGKQVHDKLVIHPKVTDAVKYTQGAIDTSEILARYFGVKKYLVGEAFQDSAAEGQAEALGFIWGKDVILAHVAERPNAMMMEPSLGYLPRWRGGAAGPWRAYVGYNPERGTGKGAKMVKVETDYKPLLTGVNLAFLLKNAVA
jgi:hypothetical protein